MNQILLFDTTLRDGEQAPGAAMNLPEKLEIAHALSQLGVDIIEAGFPVSSPGQFEAVRQIANEIPDDTVICALARAKEGDIASAAQALGGRATSRIHTFIATSDIHLHSKFADARYGANLAAKRQTVLRMAIDAVRQAREHTDDVEFSAEDAGRTDVGFLHEVVAAVVEAGATTINIPDTTGYCIPDEYAALIRSIVDIVPARVVVSTHCHDDLGLAVANSLSGVQAGARQVECTINGIGERAGNAALEEIAMALAVRADHFGMRTRVDSRGLTDMSKLVSTFSGFPVQPNKAIVGRNAFSHEAGIHQDGMLKNRDTYEIMRAEDVGQVTESIRLGRHSGRHGLFSRLEKIGVRILDDQRDTIYHAFVELADRKKEINDIDLYNLVNEHTTTMSTAHYKLEHLAVSVGTDRQPSATVRIEHVRAERTEEKTATGDGPIDALYRAIDHAVNEAHDLVSYNIRSISEGADAFGEVSVLISMGGPCFTGKASSTDVIIASAEAYVMALNSMAAYRADEESIRFVNSGIINAFDGSGPTD